MMTTSRVAAAPPRESDTISPTATMRTRFARLSARWRYRDGARDLRIDFLRGLAVFAMVANHLGGEPSMLYAVTGGNHFLFSAAEGFVFISGLVMGIVYARRIAGSGIGEAMWRMLRRTGSLYFLTVTLGFGFATLSYWTQMPWVDGVRVMDPIETIIERVTLHRAFYLTDVLLLYTLLVGVAPVVFLLLHHKRTPFVLAGSWLTWGMYQLFPEEMLLPWRIEDNSVFQFAAWQALFFTGITLGYHRDRVVAFARRIPAAPLFLALVASCVGAIVLHNTQARVFAPFTWDGDTTAIMNDLFGKADLRFGRLLAFAVFFLALLMVTTFAWGPLHRALGWLLMPLGQRALLAYGVHLGVIVAFTKFASITPALQGNTPWGNTLIQLAGVFAVWGVVRLSPALQASARRLRELALRPAESRVMVTATLAARRGPVERQER